MAQWTELLGRNLIQGQLSHFYETKFPRHIRHCLRFCIENQDWATAAVDQNTARSCFYSLLAYLDEQWNHSALENFLPGPDYPGMKDYLLKNFHDEPQKLAMILTECLLEEKKILTSASEKQSYGAAAVEGKLKHLKYTIDQLKWHLSEIKKQVRSRGEMCSKYDYIQTTWRSRVEQCNGLVQSQAVVEEECIKLATEITQSKQMILLNIGKVLEQAEQVVADITDVELPEWKYRQQMYCIGSSVDVSVDHLEKWFTGAAEVLIEARQQLQKLQDQDRKYNSMDLSGLHKDTDMKTMALLTKLLENALVVVKQPVMASIPQRPQILKTGVRFVAVVRFLANLPEFKCLLKVKPYIDKDFEEAMTMNGFRRFDFTRDNSKVLDVDAPGEGLAAEFTHMSLKETKAKTKGSCESRLTVTEELHIIKFVTEFQHAGLKFNIEASSLPLVVISATVQIPSAWASVMWNNMSTRTEQNLLLFADPPPVSWQQLSQVLSWQFLSLGRPLDENQLSVLRDKIVDDPDDRVHWCKFSKNESAWIWIDGILDLIKRHLVELWRDGCIMGFVSRKAATKLLREKQPGTFLLRFSETNKDGAISFSWVEHFNGENHVHSVEPFTKSDLLTMSLPDNIYLYSVKDGNMTKSPLTYLYPDKHKDDAIRPYCSTGSLKLVKNGYIPRKNVPFSVHPTPPPSPPQELHMDVDLNKEVIQDLFSDLFYMCESPAYQTL